MRWIFVIHQTLLPVILLTLWIASAEAQNDNPAKGALKDYINEPGKGEFGSGIEETFPQARPEDYGLFLPQGDPIPGRGRRVMLVDPYERFVVGRVHVEVHDERDGVDRYVVLLPDGRLYTVKKSDTVETDRPFRPFSKEEILEQLTTNDFQGFQSRSTARFLYVYNTTPEFAQATSTILETMYPALYKFCEIHGLEVHDPEFPLVVLMFCNREQFDRYRKQPPGAAAYYNIVSNQIVLYSDADLAKVSLELAMKNSISTIAHEGVHQILSNIGATQRLARWPRWIGEGLADYFAPTEAGKRVRWKGLGLVHDLRMYELVQHAKTTKSISTSWFGLKKTVDAERLDSLGYAVSWATVYVLAQTRREEFQSLLQELSKLGPMEAVTPGTFFRKHFGDNFIKTEQEIVAALREVDYIDPIANLTYYVGIAEVAEGRLVAALSISPRAIVEWRDKQAGLQRFAVKPFPNKSTAKNYIARLQQQK
jgi:hypothetical protein